jgi:hypothetical protein
MNYKLTVCENRLEVVVGTMDEETLEEVMVQVQEWLEAKTIMNEDYLAAMGPCGK